jgi:tRNA pseudouridine55 synthase
VIIPSGLAVIDKPAGLSSFAALGPLKRRLNTSKLGHTGTLDPFATGVLVVLVGPYSHLAPVFSRLDKRYRATLRLGVETDTLDPEGKVVEELPPPSRAALEAVLGQFRGDILQRPPAYSALHVGGKRAYERARAGEDLELPPRPVSVFELELESFEGDRAVVSMRCSSGTYVRSLARDLGRAAGSCASLSALERSSIGPFALDSAVLAEAFDPGRDLRLLEPGLAASLGLGAARLPDSAFKSFQNGGVLESAALEKLCPSSGSATAVFDSKGVFIGLVDASGQRLVYHFVVRREA